MFKKNKKDKAVVEVAKVSKKDKFKPKGKGDVKIYTSPDYIKKRYKLKEVCETGIFFFEGNYANKLYHMEVGSNVDKQTAFKKLRGYDVDFSFYTYKSMEYLLITVSAQNMNEALESFGTLETDLFSSMKMSDISLENVDFQERMEIIHKGIVNGLEDAPINVTDYVENVVGYKKDFMFEKYDAVYEDNVTTDTDTFFKMLFVRKGNNSLDEIVRKLNELSFVEEIKFDFEHLPDQAVVSFFENTYMGYEKEKKIIDKVNPEFYDVLISHPNAEDKRLFTTCGISVLLKLNSAEEELEAVADIEEIFMDTECKYEYFYGDLLSVYLSFIPFYSHGVKQNRLMQGEKCLAYFLAGKGNRNQEKSDSLFENDYSLFEESEETEAFSYESSDDGESAEEKEMASAFDYIV